MEQTKRRRDDHSYDNDKRMKATDDSNRSGKTKEFFDFILIDLDTFVLVLKIYQMK